MGMRLGHFWLNRVLAAGAMGQVWSGVHEEQGVQVAVKFLIRDATDENFRQAFFLEIQAMAGLEHPNIVRIYDHGEVQPDASPELLAEIGAGTPFIVMEQARATLGDRSGKMAWASVRRVLEDLLAGLAHAHGMGLLHKDLKPGNVLLCPAERRGDPNRVVLTDFGFAGKAGEIAKVVGMTPSFAAPEQLSFAWRDEGPWTDTFAMGTLAWHLLTGASPYVATSVDEAKRKQAVKLPPLTLPRGAPPAFQDWMKQALEQDPGKRFRSAAEALSALRDVVAQRPRTPLSLPANWRTLEAHRHTIRHLHGAGLGLFGVKGARLVGREDERGALWSALAEVERESQPAAVVIRGPRGIGKSRLVEWLAAGAHETSGTQEVSATHRDPPKKRDGLEEMLKRALRVHLLDSSNTTMRIKSWLAATGGSWWGESRGWVSLLEGNGTLGPTRYDRMLDLLKRHHRGRPLLVVLEDVHFGADALAFAKHALQGTSELPILFLLTVSDELLPDRRIETRVLAGLTDHPRVTTLQIGPLSAMECQALTRAALDLSPSLAGRIAEMSSGHPEVATRLLQLWIEDGLLVADSVGQWSLREGADPALPDELLVAPREAVDGLLQGLEEACVSALELAGVMGPAVVAAHWAAAREKAGVDTQTDLQTLLIERGLARPTASGFLFVDGRVGVVLALRAQEREKHRDWSKAAAWSLKTAPHEFLTARAQHLVDAGRPDLAMEAFRRGVLAQIEMLPESAVARRIERFQAVIDRLRPPPTDPGQVGLLQVQAVAALARGDMTATLRMATELETLSRKTKWQQGVHAALRYRAAARLRRLELAAARDLAAAAVEVELSGPPQLIAVGLLSASARLAGRMSEANHWAQHGRSLATALGDKRGEGQILLHLARLALALGRNRDADRALALASKRFEDASYPHGLAEADEAIGWLALAKEQWWQAMERFGSALRTWEAQGQVRATLHARVGLAIAKRHVDMVAEARELLLAVIEQAPECEDRLLNLRAQAAALEVAAVRGEGGELAQRMRLVASWLAETEVVDPVVARLLGSVGSLRLSVSEEAEALAAGQRNRLGWHRSEG